MSAILVLELERLSVLVSILRVGVVISRDQLLLGHALEEGRRVTALLSSLDAPPIAAFTGLVDSILQSLGLVRTIPILCCSILSDS